MGLRVINKGVMFVNTSGRPEDVPVATPRKRRALLPQPVIQSAYTPMQSYRSHALLHLYIIYVYIYIHYILFSSLL